MSSQPKKAQGTVSSRSKGRRLAGTGQSSSWGPAQVTMSPEPTLALSAWFHSTRDGGKGQVRGPAGLEKRTAFWACVDPSQTRALEPVSLISLFKYARAEGSRLS